MEPGYVVRDRLKISNFPTPERLADLARFTRPTFWQKLASMVRRFFGKK